MSPAGCSLLQGRNQASDSAFPEAHRGDACRVTEPKVSTENKVTALRQEEVPARKPPNDSAPDTQEQRSEAAKQQEREAARGLPKGPEPESSADVLRRGGRRMPKGNRTEERSELSERGSAGKELRMTAGQELTPGRQKRADRKTTGWRQRQRRDRSQACG